MKLTISDKTNFVNYFLTPISKITNTAVLKIEKNLFTSLISTSDNTIILNAEYSNEKDIDSNITLNIPDVTKLIRILSVIDSKDVELELNKNNISYSSNHIRFKYHLFEDGIIATPKLNVQKLSTLTFDGKFTLLFNSLQDLIKGSSIATDSNKIYLTFKNGTVLGELTDKARPNVDSYGLIISKDYSGTQLASPLPLNFEIFRIISSMKFKELNCSLSSKTGVFIFDALNNNIAMKFVISALAN